MSEVNTGLSIGALGPAYRPWDELHCCPNKKSAANAALFGLVWNTYFYQGTSLRSPFFFLLVDSFWSLELESVALCWEPSAVLPSAVLPSAAGVAAEPSAAGLASGVAVVVVGVTGMYRVCWSPPI